MSGHGAPPTPGGGDASGSGQQQLPPGHDLPPALPPGLPGLGTDPFGLALAAIPFDQLAATLQIQLQAQAQIQQQQLALHPHLQQQQSQPMIIYDQAAVLQAAQAAVVQQAAAQAAQEQQQQQQQIQLLQQQPKQEQSDAAAQQQPQQQRLQPAEALAAAQALQQAHQLVSTSRPRARASKEEYIGLACNICSAPADGMHYGAISCRSCNAFFRRAITYEHNYACRFGGNCDVHVQVDAQGNIIDESVRCACRACRYRKCVEAGMKKTAVQPPRDPTGSQKVKKEAVKRKQNQFDRKTAQEIMREQQIRDGAGPSNRPNIATEVFEDEDDLDMYDDDKPSSSGLAQILQQHMMSQGSPRKGMMSEQQMEVKMELDDGSTEAAILATVGGEDCDDNSSDGGKARITVDIPADRPWMIDHSGNHQFTEYEKFCRLVFCYREHTRLMQLAMTPIDAFLDQFETGITLREMVPADVGLLSTTELSGLLYWIEKMDPYTQLAACDRRALFKRYSVRKLSLDHFYVASKWKEHCKQLNFVMLNNTIVPPHRTGFELETDDDKQITAKAEIFLPTFERMWRCVIHPFSRMNITDSEMVFLHTLLLWSPLNNIHVLEETKEVMRLQREWAIRMLFRHYQVIGQDQPEVRFGEVCSLLSEVEVICDKHCQDFQVAKLFEFCDMSQYWYEKWCYSAVNTMQVPDAHSASPMLDSHGATMEQVYARELAAGKNKIIGDEMTAPSSSSGSVEDPTGAGGVDDYNVPMKRASYESTPSAPSTTPSTPHQPSL